MSACNGCGADLSSQAVALRRRQAACCRNKAFERLDRSCAEIVRSLPGVSPDERAEVCSDVLVRLLRTPPKESPPNDSAAQGYLRRALRNAWIDRQRRSNAAAESMDPEVLEQRGSAGEPEEPSDDLPTPEEVAAALEGHALEAARRRRGQGAQDTCERMLKGLIDQHLRGRRTRAELLEAEGWRPEDVNRLEKAQERARAALIEHLREKAELSSDGDEAEWLLQLAEVVAGLKEGGAAGASRRRSSNA